MFCSSCGRTLLPEDAQCRHCGTPVAESVFNGIPYTSVQKKLRPGDTPYDGGRVFVQTSFEETEDAPAENDRAEAAQEAEAQAAPETAFDAPEEEAEAPVDVETPEAPRKEIHTGAEAADEELREGEREISSLADDVEELHARPIVSQGQSGISTDISEYMEKVNARSRKNARRKRRSVGEDAESAEAAEAEAQTAAPAPQTFAEEDETEDEELDERPHLSPKALQAIKIVALLVLLAAVATGVVFWVRHVSERSQGSPIEGVSLELYNSGIAMIERHANSEYTKTLLETYTRDGILTLTQQLEGDASAITALTPAEASIGDSQFIGALRSIQTNINNAVTMDALAIAQPTDDAQAASESRWRVINDSITQLKAATTTNELDAIINGERIAIQTVAPTPTPMPEKYTALTRGDTGDEVKQMQERLWELGFLQDVRDGNFGGNTYTAVKSFQQAAGLDVTGIADNKTLTRLYADDAPRTQKAQPTEGAANGN